MWSTTFTLQSTVVLAWQRNELCQSTDPQSKQEVHELSLTYHDREIQFVIKCMDITEGEESKDSINPFGTSSSSKLRLESMEECML